jgi:hypothetical protein
VRSRSAIAVILAASGLLSVPQHAAGAGPSPPANRGPQVIVAVLPPPTVVSDLAEVEGMTPGLLSAGIGGSVPATQTYLDISQGARVFEHLYDEPLPPFLLTDRGVEPAAWDEVVARAESAPADVVPGLLGSSIEGAGLRARAEAGIGHAALIAANEEGRVDRLDNPRCAREGCGPGLSVVVMGKDELAAAAAGLRGDDLLIAVRDAPPLRGHQLPIGIAGRGFGEGALTSDSTRTDGFVLTTDVAPTILRRLGIEVPDDVAGRSIRAAGSTDLDGLQELDRRLSQRPSRGTVIGIPLLAWVLLTGLTALALRSRGGRTACAALGLSAVYLPTLLLVGAALKTSEPVEALIVALGSPLFALATLAAMRGYAALAVACAITVGAHAVDVVAGSPLTALSVLGPNPAGGVRFFGIGNELEAAIAVMVPLGVGAWLGSTRAHSPRFAAAAFALAALVATLVFAPGRFGADVGAAIVLPAGAVVAVALVLGLSVRTALLVLVGVCAGGVALLAVVDLVAGGDAHLSRSVLGAGGSDEVGEVLSRRLRLTARSFYDPAYPALLVVTWFLLAIGYRYRQRIMGWFGDRDAARAGFLAALGATVVGTLANDSGAILLIIGTILLALTAGFFWARAPLATPGPKSRKGLG